MWHFIRVNTVLLRQKWSSGKNCNLFRNQNLWPIEFYNGPFQVIASIQKEEFISSFKSYYIQQQSLNYMYMMKHQILWISCCCHSLNCIYSKSCKWERSGSVVECLTRDRRAAGSSLTGVTALCPWARTLILAKYWFNQGRPVPL